jgi:molybdopterin molybdotransferase
MTAASGLLSVRQALERILAALPVMAVEYVSLPVAVGRVLAEAVSADFDLPQFTNSSMDGFAVRAADVQEASPTSPAQLLVIADIPAGAAGQVSIQTGRAARIMTGAVLPTGADAVAPVEITDLAKRPGGGEAAPPVISIYQPVTPGENVRQVGQDVRAGETVLLPKRLRPPDIGFLAMIGKAEVLVRRRPRIALMSTGDELQAAGEKPQAGKIYDANSYTLGAAIQQAGSELLWLGIIPDQQAAVQAALERAVEQEADLILSSAGVSVGAFDFVRSVLEQHGSLTFWRVNMRPGKPLAFGSYRGVPFVGLPGNPVSAYVGFEVFIRPGLEKMLGLPGLHRASVQARLEESIDSDGRESYLRAVLTPREGQFYARLTGHQGSGNLHSLVQANSLLIIPSGVKSLPSGALAEAWLLDGTAGG